MKLQFANYIWNALPLIVISNNTLQSYSYNQVLYMFCYLRVQLNALFFFFFFLQGTTKKKKTKVANT